MKFHVIGDLPHLSNPDFLKQRSENYGNRICMAIHCGRSTGKFWGLCTRHRTVLNTYGLDPDDYEMMRIAQEYRCGICKKHESDASRGRLVVDHNHTTGEVRGLLCQQCNTGIGMMQDSRELVNSATTYLERNND